jgi:hypothetical protein
MSNQPNITVTVIFHREGPFALPALDSMKELVGVARADGLIVEARAVLDRADDLTRHLVAARGSWLNSVEEVTYGDLGLSRNAGAQAANGEFLAFLDGDDLWGSDWLRLAYKAATSSSAPAEAVWHPDYLFYFTEGDFDRHSVGATPHPDARSFYMQQVSSMSNDFERGTLMLNNIWSANVFAARALHMKYPYEAVDRTKGFGIEDWSWHMGTVWSEVPHLIVPDTVHIIRVKEGGSLGQQNTSEGLLPTLPRLVPPADKWWR